MNEHWKIPFGHYKGKKLRDCPDIFLKWCVEKLWDTDLHPFAVGAKQVLESRNSDSEFQDLEAEADDILKRAGYKLGKNGEIL